MLVRLISQQARGCLTRKLSGLQLYNQRKSREREKKFCHSWVDVILPALAPPGWAGEFSCPHLVKLGPQIVVYVCRQDEMVPKHH